MTCVNTWKPEAPSAMRVPNSRTRSATEASRMLAMTTPPANSEMIPTIRKMMLNIRKNWASSASRWPRGWMSKSSTPCIESIIWCTCASAAGPPVGVIALSVRKSSRSFSPVYCENAVVMGM